MRIGLPTLLFLLFLTLQLAGNIDWPWYAIAAPLFVATGLWFVAAIVIFIAAIKAS